MPVKIKKVDIHALRGIPDLQLELNGKSLLLRGENATGKSSIVEAIEFFFTGKISHLEGTRGLSLQRHGPHVDFQPNEVNVEITFDPGNVSLRRTLESQPSPPEAFKDYFEVAQKGTFILRRSQILKFIMSDPADRFRAIGSIIGVEPLDEIELEMMRVRDGLKGEIDYREPEIYRLIGDVCTIIRRDVTSIEDVVPALNKMLQEADLPPIESLEAVDQHAEEMLRKVRKAETIDRIGALNEILGETKTAPIAGEIDSELRGLNDKVKQLLEQEIRSGLSIVELLQSGRQVIEEERLDICPLCEQEIEREGLLARIDMRLRTLRDLSEKAAQVRSEGVAIIGKLKRISGTLDSTASKLQSFPELAKEKDQLSKQIQLWSVLIDKVNSAKDLKDEIPVEEFGRRKDEIYRVWGAISGRCNRLIEDIGLTEEEKKVLGVVRLIEQARSKCRDISRVQSELRKFRRLHELA